MEATDRESEAPILKSGMKRFFKRCWRTGITAECLSVLWFSQQLLIRLTSHVVGVSLRTRGSAESRASSWDQSAAALHPPDVHVMSTGLLVCCWSRWMCSETAAARSFAIFPPDKTQTHHLSPAAPQRFPLEGRKKEPVVLSYKTLLWRNAFRRWTTDLSYWPAGRPSMLLVAVLLSSGMFWTDRPRLVRTSSLSSFIFWRRFLIRSRSTLHRLLLTSVQLTPQTGSEVQWRNDLYFYSFRWLGNGLVPELNTLKTSDRKCELRCKIYIQFTVKRQFRKAGTRFFLSWWTESLMDLWVNWTLWTEVCRHLIWCDSVL